MDPVKAAPDKLAFSANPLVTVELSAFVAILAVNVV
jgi:hypothetical protein